ncbi:MAG: chlorophyll synthase ChlG [Gemmatimonadota bacterium]
MNVATTLQSTDSSLRRTPAPAVVLELLKPVTWFPPMWAFACGAISSGAIIGEHRIAFATGIVLTGPLVCAASQAINDWYDRHVDAINEPDRPIPSGRVPGMWGLVIAVAWSLLSLAVGATLGIRGVLAAIIAIVLAWAYSAPPLRLKRNGWYGNLAVGLSYEGLAWIAGAALMLAPALPSWRVAAVALMYSIGAHGIMTLNDFKSIEGDRVSGVRSLPVQLGAKRAGLVACAMMLVPQVVVVALLWRWSYSWQAAAVTVLALVQIPLMRRLLQSPKARAPWYNQTGVTLYVSGMMLSAFALRAVAR